MQEVEVITTAGNMIYMDHAATTQVREEVLEAMLSDSVPPLVNTTSLMRQPRMRATVSRDSSTAFLASCARV